MKVGAGLLALVSVSLSVPALLGSSTAQADTVIVAEAPKRDGLMMGASIGRGSIAVECKRCDEGTLTDALSVAAHVGYMITPRLAILGEHWSVRYNQRGGAWFDDSVYHLVAQHQSMLAAQLFVTDSVWLKAGLGVGWHVTDGRYAQPPLPVEQSGAPLPAAGKGEDQGPASEVSSDGAATALSLGWEFAHNSVFAADVQLRLGTTRNFDGKYDVVNTGINVGFNWY